MKRKGWFKIPGVQDGDRTLEEQIEAIRPALDEVRGKVVLDMGCAEGLIGREFARAGAARVHGIDSVEAHIAAARQQCAELPMTFQSGDLQKISREALAAQSFERFDFVLALGICHKFRFPEHGVRFAAKSCRELLLLRGFEPGGIVRSKHFKMNKCDAHAVFEAEGFVREPTRTGGTHFEAVEYWRRRA